jgi:hypothetical protein
MAKKLISMRLPEATIKELAFLAEREKVSPTEIISVLVRLLYTGDDIEKVDEWLDIVRRS